jgi:hypothetical protein
MGYVSYEAAETGGDLEVKLMNEWFPARILSGTD